MIEETDAVFPNNVVNALYTAFQTIDEDVAVLRRPLRSSDPVQCIGILPVQWNPEDDTLEMRGGPNLEPTLNRYIFGVQAFIKDMDEERGLIVHSVLAKRVQRMLYRDSSLRLALSSLSTMVDGVGERAQRWGVRTQRYVSNEIDGSFLYLSILEFWLETETY